jgi:trehalose-phosphatase
MPGVSPSPLSQLPLRPEAVMAARRRHGLVAVFDFDGTLVPIERSPEAVQPAPEAARMLETLAQRPDTLAAVVSGRGLDELVRRLDAPSVWLVGLHGWEHRPPHDAPMRVVSPMALDLAQRQRVELARRLQPGGGLVIEDKGPIIAIHTRLASPDRRREAERAVREARIPDFELVAGRCVLELRPTRGPTKGTAVRTIAATRPGTSILYVGDDTTDEDAFAELGADDFAVIVDDAAALAERPGTRTRARYDIAGPAAVTHLLALLAHEAACPT